MKGIVNILVLGKEDVGKTAIIVRYLTGRYLSEYAHAPEMTYERTVLVEGKLVPLKVTDVAGKNLDQKSSSKEILTKVDGVVVVYSITDRHSFNVAEGICDWLRRERKMTSQVPVVLLGNKNDLAHLRCVSCQKADGLEWRPDSYLATECSASSDPVAIVNVINALISKILEKRDSSAKQTKKLSQNPLGSPKIIRASLRRKFSVFSRERTSTM